MHQRKFPLASPLFNSASGTWLFNETLSLLKKVEFEEQQRSL